MRPEAASTHLAGETSGAGVYERVKARIVAQEFAPGSRILVEPLAERLFVSATPVREALIRLAAEHVIKDIPKAGFFVKEISESEIRNLFALQERLLIWSLSELREGARAPGMLKPPDFLTGIDRDGSLSPANAVLVMDRLFAHVARQSGNSDVAYIIRNINDRTYYVRKREFDAFDDATDELTRLCQSYCQRNFDELRDSLSSHFHKKARRLPQLLRFIRGSALDVDALSAQGGA